MLKEKHRIQAARVVYETYWDSYTKGDLETFSSTLDDRFEMIGTSETEICHTKAEGIEFLKSQIAEVVGKAELRNRQIDMVPVDRLMLVNEQCGIYVLVDSVWNFYSKIRISTWLRETETGWKVVQQHGSLPDMRVGEGETLAIDKISRENLELRDAVKRRTAELEIKNRELEIEAALDRVRVRAMAMQHSNELADLVAVIFTELVKLDFSLTRCYIYIIDPGSLSLEAWTFNTEIGGIPSSFQLQYLDLPYYRAMIKAWKAQDKKLVYELSGEDKKETDRVLFGETAYKNLPEAVKAGMTSVEKVYLSFSFNHFGAIQTGGLEPLSDEKLEIFDRFGNVFDLTYTRFNDLKQAESQAREAQIEAALERLRSASMAMHKTEDIDKVLSVFYAQLQALDLNPSFTYVTIYPSSDTWTIRMTDTAGRSVSGEAEVSMDAIPVWRESYEHWKASEEYAVFVIPYTQEELPFVIDLLDDVLSKMDPGYRPKVDDYPNGIWSIQGHTPYGWFGVNQERPPTEEELKIIPRFSREFGRMYHRFLELQRAEAQAREANIEAALERVRAASMAMHHSEDIGKVLSVLYAQLKALELDPVNTYVVNYNTAADTFTLRITDKAGNGIAAEQELSLDLFPVWQDSYEQWKSSKEYGVFVFHYKQEELPVLLNSVEEVISKIESENRFIPEDYPNGWWTIQGHTPYGWFGMVLESPPTEEELKIAPRFSREFGRMYQRFLELQKAEAQAREAQIEAALERVRSRTMAMQHSNELSETAAEMFIQMQLLGIHPWSCGFNIINQSERTISQWVSSGDGRILPSFESPSEEDVFVRFTEAFRQGDPLYVEEMGGEALEAHYRYLTSIPAVGKIAEEMKAAGIHLPVFQVFNLAFFKFGYLMLITYEQVPAFHEIFQRFAKVFEQTYTRFLDLQRAEAQARQSQIEAALERVRARALAMQQPEELKEVAEVMRLEMGLLGVEELETSSIFLHGGRSGKAECWYAIKDIRTPEKKLLADHFTLDLPATWVGRQMHAFYKSADKQISIPMQGPNRKEWINYCSVRSRRLEGFYGDDIPDRTYHLCKFSNGTIGAATPGTISEESWVLLQRAASVFSLAYARFRDLTRARLDLQRLKEEKLRAETALSELRAAQAQLIHTEKMASLGELTAGIAHEIQNPLNFVNNFSEVNMELMEELKAESSKLKAERDEALEEELWRDLQENEKKINHHGKRADAIVKGMLQHSRTSSGIKEPTNINALADEYLRLSYHGLRAKDKAFNADFRTELEPALPGIKVIPQDVGRVLLNLINNAFHAVSEKAKKGIPDYKPLVTVKTKKHDHLLEIRVKDNGDGIPDEIVNKIFQPFFTTKPTGEGTGLGLSLSYDIITKGHNGTLEVDTTAGVGSEFVVQLPI